MRDGEVLSPRGAKRHPFPSPWLFFFLFFDRACFFFSKWLQILLSSRTMLFSCRLFWLFSVLGSSSFLVTPLLFPFLKKIEKMDNYFYRCPCHFFTWWLQQTLLPVMVYASTWADKKCSSIYLYAELPTYLYVSIRIDKYRYIDVDRQTNLDRGQYTGRCAC